MNKSNLFQTVVIKAMEKTKLRNKSRVADAMGISRQQFEKYYNGTNQPSVKKAIEMFNAVGYDVQVIEKIN